jgi:hypothetical protein
MNPHDVQRAANQLRDILSANVEGNFYEEGIATALLEAGWKPPLARNETILECDSVTLHRSNPLRPIDGPVTSDVDLGEQLGERVTGVDRYTFGDPGFVDLEVPRDLPDPVGLASVRAIAWRGDTPVWAFQGLATPLGASYRVGPFPIVMTVSDV